MRSILRIVPGHETTPGEIQRARLDATDFVRLRGTPERPEPPRGVIVQAGPRGLLVTWNLPENKPELIAKWRIYKDTENFLYDEISDRGVRTKFIDSTSGTTPPTTNIFVSAVNSLGIESQKIQAQGKATAETGAPSFPSPPPEYVDVSSGGGDQNGAIGRVEDVA